MTVSGIRMELHPTQVTEDLGELMALMGEHYMIGDKINGIRRRLVLGVHLGPGESKSYQLPGFNAAITEKDGQHVFSFTSVQS
jgi:hypothetical protein